jgi:hypothetical protein
MTKINDSFKITDFNQSISVYQKTLQTDTIRSIKHNVLTVVAHFKAMIDEPFYTKPETLIADIYHIKHVYVRVSNFYRPIFKKNNYIKHQESFLRIASVHYNFHNGMMCCVCYDSDPLIQGISVEN